MGVIVRPSRLSEPRRTHGQTTSKEATLCHDLLRQKLGPAAGFLRSRGALVVWPSFAGHPAGVFSRMRRGVQPQIRPV